MHIVFINGIARSGKDTFVEYCAKYKSVSLISTVDAVKDICRREFGWDGIKDDKGRKLLASIRKVWAEYNDGPVNTVRNHIEKSKDVAILFIMVREFDEMIRMQDLFGGSTLNIIRPDIEICETEQKFLDMVPNDYDYNLVIVNDSDLSNLDLAAKQFCSLFN